MFMFCCYGLCCLVIYLSFNIADLPLYPNGQQQQQQQQQKMLYKCRNLHSKHYKKKYIKSNKTDIHSGRIWNNYCPIASSSRTTTRSYYEQKKIKIENELNLNISQKFYQQFTLLPFIVFLYFIFIKVEQERYKIKKKLLLI